MEDVGASERDEEEDTEDENELVILGRERRRKNVRKRRELVGMSRGGTG